MIHSQPTQLIPYTLSDKGYDIFPAFHQAQIDTRSFYCGEHAHKLRFMRGHCKNCSAPLAFLFKGASGIIQLYQPLLGEGQMLPWENPPPTSKQVNNSYLTFLFYPHPTRKLVIKDSALPNSSIRNRM